MESQKAEIKIHFDKIIQASQKFGIIQISFSCLFDQKYSMISNIVK